MAADFSLVIDCAAPERLARFWAAALGYIPEPPPDGMASWDDYWRSIGLPEEDLGIGDDRIIDPDRRGPGIWFQLVPEGKTSENRLHIDIHASGGRDLPLETRQRQVEAEAARLAGLAPPGSAPCRKRASTITPWPWPTRKATSSTSTNRSAASRPRRATRYAPGRGTPIGLG